MDMWVGFLGRSIGLGNNDGEVMMELRIMNYEFKNSKDKHLIGGTT